MKSFKYIFLLIPTILSAEPTYDERLDYVHSIRMDQALEARRLLDELSNSLSDFNKEQKARYYVLDAHNNAMQAKYSEAIKLADKSINVVKDIDLNSRAKSIKASALYLSGQYRSAFSETYELLDQVDQLKSLKTRNDVLMNAIANHLSAQILDKAQALSLQSLAFARKHKNLNWICQSRFQLAGIKQRLGQYNTAVREAEETLPICIKVDNRLYQLGLKEIIAEAKLKKGELESAKKLYLELYKTSSNFGWAVYTALVEIRLAETYFELKEFTSVEQYALPAYRYSKETNDYQRLKSVSLILAKFYKETGDLKKARLYNQEYRDAMVITSQQLEKTRLGYYQAMNDRQKNMASNPSLALKKINSN